MAYTNQSSLENFLLIEIDDDFYTAQVTHWVTAIENYINLYCGREFEEESGVSSKLYDGDGSDELLMGDVYDFTKIEILDEDGNVSYTIDDADEYYIYPVNKKADEPYTSVVLNKFNAPISYFPRDYQNVKVYGSFGYAADVPKDIRLAATKLVAGIIQERNLNTSGEIKKEKLGEYDVTFQNVTDMANHLGINAILDKYRIIKV